MPNLMTLGMVRHLASVLGLRLAFGFTNEKSDDRLPCSAKGWTRTARVARLTPRRSSLEPFPRTINRDRVLLVRADDPHDRDGTQATERVGNQLPDAFFEFAGASQPAA